MIFETRWGVHARLIGLAHGDTVGRLCFVDVLMSMVVPSLIQCSGERCDTPSPVVSSSEVVRTLGQNQLRLRDVALTDGNCGVHAFFLSVAELADFAGNFKVKTKTAQLITHLRRVAVQWMKDWLRIAYIIDSADTDAQLKSLLGVITIHIDQFEPSRLMRVNKKIIISLSLYHYLIIIIMIIIIIYCYH